MPYGDLTTLADVKAWLQTGQNPFPATDDALLQRLIAAASEFIQNWLGRPIASGDWLETRDGTGEVSKALGSGETVTFSQKDMSDAVKTALASYRAVMPAGLRAASRRPPPTRPCSEPPYDHALHRRPRSRRASRPHARSVAQR